MEQKTKGRRKRRAPVGLAGVDVARSAGQSGGVNGCDRRGKEGEKGGSDTEEGAGRWGETIQMWGTHTHTKKYQKIKTAVGGNG